MKKALIIVLAIAILGAVAMFGGRKSQSVAPRSITTTPAIIQAAPSVPVPTGSSAYKDGTYTGKVSRIIYGNIQAAVVISGGKITDIQFLQMPSDERQSQEITAYSEPQLKQAALSKQNTSIDFVTGATDTSQGFEKSLQSALNQAANS